MVDREHALQLEVLNYLASDLSSCVDLDEVFRHVFEVNRKIVPNALRTSYAQLSHDKSELRLLAKTGMINSFSVPLCESPLDIGLISTIVRCSLWRLEWTVALQKLAVMARRAWDLRPVH